MIAVKNFVCCLLLVFAVTGCRGWWFWTPGDTVDDVGYHPIQPINFSHKNHAQDRNIPCEYCHSSARRSASAGVPPTNTCMGCHKIVGTDNPEIQYLTEKYEKNEPIEWVKVHDMPDYVHFTHKQHLHANLECQDCHGKVEEMGTAVQVAPLQMGWCVECHVKKEASLQCQACHY
jgi:hypothetical protein